MTSPAASTDVCDLTAHELLAAYRARALSPVEVVDALLARIDALDPALGAFTALCAERARREAAAHERAYLSGRPAGPLAGVPIGSRTCLLRPRPAPPARTCLPAVSGPAGSSTGRLAGR